MKNFQIQSLVNIGIMGITSNTLTASSAYAVTQFKKEINRILEDMQSKDGMLVKEAGIEDGQALDTRKKELDEKENKTAEEKKELDGMEKKLTRLMELRQIMYNEDVTIKCKTMPYEDWHALKAENKDVKVNNTAILDAFELEFENILWVAPEE